MCSFAMFTRVLWRNPRKMVDSFIERVNHRGQYDGGNLCSN